MAASYRGPLLPGGPRKYLDGSRARDTTLVIATSCDCYAVKPVPASPPSRQRVLALAVDAPNQLLLQQWIDAGDLPNLAQLRARSRCFTLQSEKRFSNEHCWIPVLTGRRRDRWSHWLDAWDPQAYQFKEASLYDWLQAPLFYALGSRRHVVAFDLAAPVVDNVQGVQVSGFAVELNESFPQSAPPELMDRLVARYGPDPKLERHQQVTNAVSQREGLSWIVPSCYRQDRMQAFSEALLASVERRTAACLELLDSEPWDLFIAAYSEIHSAGHILWHLSQPHPLSVLRGEAADPMRAVYLAIDESIARLVVAAGEDVTVVVFTLDATVVDSLENARAVFLPEFMYRWNFPGEAALAVGDPQTPPVAPRLDYQQHWKHEIWALRTPAGDRVLESPVHQEARGDPMSWCPGNWYAPCWPRMRAFAMPSVADGSVRLNVRGREARGQVEPADFAAECDRLAHDIATLVDARTGRPIVREVLRVRDDPFDADPGKPPADLIVVCHEDGPLDVVDSPLVGRIGPIPFFRTSSHQAHGCVLENLMFVRQPGVEPVSQASGCARLEDVPATLLALMGEPVPADFDGRALLARAATPP